MIFLERLKGGPVLNTEATEVAESDRFACALQAARTFGHHFGLAVRDLVLDVVVLSLISVERLQPAAWLLRLTGERHDAEELWLWLRERLAVANLTEVKPLQIGVRGVSAAASVGDRGHNSSGAVSHVAAAKDAIATRLEGDRVCLEATILRCGNPVGADAGPGHVWTLADRLQDAIALNNELGAWRRFWPAPA